MKRAKWLLLLLALRLPLQADTTLDTAKVKKAVVFIYAADAQGKADRRHPLGTGFLIMVPLKGSPLGKDAVVTGQLLLVTARHLVDPAWAFCSTPQPELIYIRVNSKNYNPAKDALGVDYLPIRLVEKGKKQYFVNDDDKVDAAVTDVGLQLSQDKNDYAPIRLSVFANSDEVGQLKIGDSIISAGLLPGRSGEKRNYPFFKFGDISNIPDEPVWIGCEKGMPELRLERVWIVAASLVGGNSGSPIFYAPSFLSKITRGVIIGLQSSSFGDPEFGSAGVAGMTPIEDIFKIIEQHVAPEMDLYRGDDSNRK